MDNRFIQRTRSAAFHRSVVAWMVTVGIAFASVLFEFILRIASSPNSTENFRGEFKVMIWAAIILFSLLILIYLINFWIEKRSLFPDIKITSLPLDNAHLNNKGKFCFYLDIHNNEIEKLTEFTGNISTIVRIIPDGSAEELIIDPSGAFLIWKGCLDPKITIEGYQNNGHAVLQIAEEDGLFIRFIAFTLKNTKLQLDEFSPNNWMVDLWVELELNGIWKGTEIHPIRHYWNIGYHLNGGGVDFKKRISISPAISDIVFRQMPEKMKKGFIKATKETKKQIVYNPVTLNSFFKGAINAKFYVK